MAGENESAAGRVSRPHAANCPALQCPAGQLIVVQAERTARKGRTRGDGGVSVLDGHPWRRSPGLASSLIERAAADVVMKERRPLILGAAWKHHSPRLENMLSLSRNGAFILPPSTRLLSSASGHRRYLVRFRRCANSRRCAYTARPRALGRRADGKAPGAVATWKADKLPGKAGHPHLGGRASTRSARKLDSQTLDGDITLIGWMAASAKARRRWTGPSPI
ncbi:MAG: hypothetical protein U5M23_16415 [Marinagarivorans sp.]|nr:hypothetical protein [Marinagarivorans sp.]